MQYVKNQDKNCDDIALVTRIKNKDDDAFELICAHYMGLISGIASKYRYCAQGYELSDFVQEGLIGLLSACKSFDENGGMTFKNYAMLCVENRYRSILRHHSSKGQVPHTQLVPIDDSINSLEDHNAMTMQELFESKEYIRSVFSKIEGVLSDLEKKVLSLYLSGYTYKQSATALFIYEKAVDNALSRIRKKLSG